MDSYLVINTYFPRYCKKPDDEVFSFMCGTSFVNEQQNRMASTHAPPHPWYSIQHQFRLRQPVRPFVSSTFTDFQEEREHLVKYVFPQLNSLCHQRGTYFAPVDLRWGISEDQSHAANVVSLCLDYIKHCHPFFICLLGERYGTYRSTDKPSLPSVVDPGEKYADVDWLGKNFLNAAAKGHDWILQKVYQNCSITELEILEAAFRNDNEFCRFYIRDVRHIENKYLDLPDDERSLKLQIFKAEDAETEMRVTDLKYRIANKGLHSQSFLTVEELGEKVLKDWVSVINQFYPPMLKLPEGITGEQFSEWALGESLAETRRRVFVPTSDTIELFNIIDQHVLQGFPNENSNITDFTDDQLQENEESEPTGIITLIGDRGCGKSTIVANWVKQFSSRHSGIKVIAHYVGSSSFSTDIIQFMRRTIWELRGKPAEVSSDMSAEDLSSFHEICEAFVAAIECTPCVLVLDGLDVLGGSLGVTKHQVKELFWLPEKLSAHCKIITTTIRSDLSYKALSQRADNAFHVVPLFRDSKDKATVLQQLLALHCKALNKQHLDAIVNAKLSSRPLFLSIVANELKLFGTYMKVEECLEQYVNASTFRDLWKLVIIRWNKDYGWTRSERLETSSTKSNVSEFDGWVADTLRLIACSREGLTEASILCLLKMFGYTKGAEVTPFEFALFRSATFDTLVERPGGLLNFCHQHLREAVEYFLLGIVSGLTSPAKRKMEPGSPFLPTAGKGRKILFHEILGSYFQKQPHSRLKAQELPYHLLQCEDWKGLRKEIMKPNMFLTLYEGASQRMALKTDLIHYWRRLLEEDVDMVTAVLDMVSTTLYRDGDDESTEAGSTHLSYYDGISETDSFCSDDDSLASNDSRLESIISAMREIEVKESGNRKTHRQDFDALKDVGRESGQQGKIEQLSHSHYQEGKSMENYPALGGSLDQKTVTKIIENTGNESKEASQEKRDVKEASQGKGNGCHGNEDGAGSKEEEVSREVCSQEEAGNLEEGDSEIDRSGDKEGTSMEEPVGESSGGDLVDSDDDVSMSSLPSEVVRSQPALLAVRAGMFLAERSIFTQASQVLQLAYQEVIRYFPLNTKEQFLLTEIQEALGNLSLYQLHKSPAKSWYKKALATVDNMCIGEKDADYKEMLEIQGRILNHLGHMAAYDKNTAEAEKYLKKAKKCMELCNSVAGQATAQYNLGLLRAKTGNFREAEKHLREALHAREHWYGKSHPHVAEVLNNLAGLLSDPLNTESYDRIVAEALYQRTLRIRKMVYGDDHLLVATTLFHLGKLLKRDTSLSCKKEALKLLRKALDIRVSALGSTHKLTFAVRNTLKQLEQELRKGHYNHAKAQGAERRESATAYSGMTWHETDLEILDRKVEESRTKQQYWQKYGPQAQGSHSPIPGPARMRGKTSDGAGRERVQNRLLDKPRFRARSSSPALVRNLHGRGREGEQNKLLVQSPSTKRRVSPAVSRDRSKTEDTTSVGHQNKRQRPRTASASLNRSLYEPRPHLTMSQVSYASHHSSCDIPQAFELHPSNSITVQGPHSELTDLLGEPQCPRPVKPRGVYQATWYHEPGRYPKDNSDVYPPRRHQQRPNRSVLPDIQK